MLLSFRTQRHSTSSPTAKTRQSLCICQPSSHECLQQEKITCPISKAALNELEDEEEEEDEDSSDAVSSDEEDPPLEVPSVGVADADDKK